MTVLRPSSLRSTGGMLRGVAFEKDVEQKRLQDVVGVMAQRDLAAAFLDGSIVEDSPAQPRAERAGGFAFCQSFF